MITVLLADGFEEIEALTPVDILRRAGLRVNTVSVGKETVIGAHGITVTADMRSEQVNTDDIDVLILPGGMPGTLNLDSAKFTDDAVRSVNGRGGLIAAICAAPLILGRRGLLNGVSAVCYPGFEDELRGACIAEANVTSDKNIICAKGMGVAVAFALEIVKKLCGEETARKISAAIINS